MLFGFTCFCNFYKRKQYIQFILLTCFFWPSINELLCWFKQIVSFLLLIQSIVYSFCWMGYFYFPFCYTQCCWNHAWIMSSDHMARVYIIKTIYLRSEPLDFIIEYIFSLFLFCGTGVWTQDFAFAKQVLYCLRHSFSPFFSGYFGDRVSWAISPSWPQTTILLISIS
jgi:hypothetical protein